ncbi:SdrD B-like domain-containing protein [Celeribacter sp.]|uniref:DUF7507 domain-containing protein n=1 Tax=Celeribacter sp. TaxID=1890673 RepID=UPI003A8DC1F6
MLSLLVTTVVAASQALAYDLVLNVNDSGSDPTPAGGSVTYNVTVENNDTGAGASTATQLTLDIPAGTELTDVTNATCSAAFPVAGAGSLTCDIPALAEGANFSLEAVVKTSTSGTIDMGFSLPADDDDTNNSFFETTTILNGADVELTITGPANAVSGEVVTYTYTLVNSGPDDAEDVVVEIPAISGLDITNVPNYCSASGGGYLCTIPSDIANGDDFSFDVIGQITIAGGGSDLSVVATASVGSDSDPTSPRDPMTDDNTDTFGTTIADGSDVAISKTSNAPDPTLVDSEVIFTLAPIYTGGVPYGLEITDTVPAQYEIDQVEVQSGGWDCDVDEQVVSCERESTGLNAGSGVSLGEILIHTTVVGDGDAENTAEIFSITDDPNPYNNEDSDGTRTIEVPSVDLAVTKTGPDPALVVVGNAYNFNLRTQNTGNADFYGTIYMTDSLPAGMRFTSYSGTGWDCAPYAAPAATPPATSPLATPADGPVDVVCERTYEAGTSGPLEASDYTPFAEITVEATQSGRLVNNASVSSPEYPGAGEGNTASYEVDSSFDTASADLTLIKTAALPSLNAGDTQTYTIEVVNEGPQASADVEVTDSLVSLINNLEGPTGAGLVSVTALAGATCSTSPSGGRSIALSCVFDTLPVCSAGSCPEIEVQVRPGGDAGDRSNTAQVISTSVADPNLKNNSDTVDFEIVARTDVTVTKTATPSTAIAGQNLTYTVAAKNPSPVALSTAENVTITDTLPDGLLFVSATPQNGSCSTTPTVGTITAAGNNQVTCNLGSVASGGQRTVTIVVQPTETFVGGDIVNNATVSTSTPETDSGNNEASVSTPVVAPVYDLQVNKIDDIDPVATDQDVTYTVTIQNNGPSAAEAVTVSDLMPPSFLSYQSHTAMGATCGTVPAVGSTGGTLECTFDRIEAGGERTVTIIARGEDKGTTTNTAELSSPGITAGYDPLPGNNRVEEKTTVRTRADVEVVSKVATSTSGTAIDEIDLREGFNFVITVRNNNTGSGLREADDVEVTDSLPSGMVLTGTPSVTSSATSSATCSGVEGEISFTCELGTFDSGGEATITVPVKVIAVLENPQEFTNEAEITTSSLDVNPNNNTNKGDVDVVSSSISGTVFRDFNNDVVIDAEDTGIKNVTVTVSGTAFDGTPITATATTDANGNYTVPNLPRGTYTVTRGTVSEAYLNDGGSDAGSAGGNDDLETVISAVELPSNTDVTEYDFGLVPQARIGIAKSVTKGPTTAADGSFTVTFGFVVENFSLETLENIAVTDALAGTLPLFGTHVSLTTPATDPMSAGQYTVLSVSGGSCGGAISGFNGDTDHQVLASGVTLTAGDSCDLSVELRVRPTVSGQEFKNQALVTGTGLLTGQTPDDLSDNGTDPDPNGNGTADDADEDEPTPVTAGDAPSITLVKTADTTDFSNPPAERDTITYHYEITNTGPTTLTAVTLTDPMTDLDLNGGTITSLAPGETDSTTYWATYELKQADINRGSLTNTAKVVGTDPFGVDVEDEDTVVTPVTREPSIDLIKEADASNVSDPAVKEQEISYSFTVTNTGNVTLTNVTISDALEGIDLDGDPILSLAPGESDSTTFKATYELTQADLDKGKVENSAIVTASDPDDNDVTDVSDDPTDPADEDPNHDGNPDDPTVVPIGQAPSIQLVKTVDNSGLTQTIGQVDEELVYTFTVTNTGNVTLKEVKIYDPLLGSGQISEIIASLAPGGEYTFTEKGFYAITQTDIDNGTVVNTATATGTYGTDEFGDPLTVSDDDTAEADTVFIQAIPEPPFVFDTDGGTTTSMLASDLLGTEPATVDNVTISVEDTDPELTLDPTTGLITLSEGNPAGTYEVTYKICRKDNPLVCDQATETVIQRPISAIEAVKTQELTDNGDGVDGVGDLMTYTITVENLGNTTVNDVVLDDTFLTLDTGEVLALDSGPTFVSADQGSSEGTLLMGETATYTATFELTIGAVDAGGLSNQVKATAMPEYPPEFTDPPVEVSDVSDDGDDTDGNSEDDPTVYPLEPLLYDSGLVLTKTTPRGVVERGSTVPYTITVTNENPRTGGTMDLMDVLPADFVYVEGTATWDGEPFDVDVQGKVVTWGTVRVPPLTTIEATLEARVLTSADAGDHVNRVRLRDSTTREPLSPEATATVTIIPEPVFDCGDVYGKVFNDLNRDGYQNAPFSPIIDDDAMFSGKYSGKGDVAADVERDIVENGIPAVRLTGVDGTVITTDEYGRYHVPCAMLPQDRGSNFILKLDTRSLPTGYRLTTENPRVVRLTPGKMTEMNFGAALTRVVRVDVNAQGFVQARSGLDLSAELAGALEGLVDQIAGEPVHLRIIYHLPDDAGSEDKRLAQKSMREVERELRDLWKEPSRVKLTIEKTIVRVEQ